MSQLLRRGLKLVRHRSLRWRRGGRYARRPQAMPGTRNVPSLATFAERKLALTRERVDAAGEQPGQGRVRLLDHEVELGHPVDWRVPGVSRLWRFHLHYHEHLLERVAAAHGADRPRAVAEAWRIVEDWIDAVEPGERSALEDGWHPFCISRRLPVWIALWHVAEPPQSLRDDVLRSMLQQTRFLADHLEFDLGGNHLLENLRTLLLCGSFLSGDEADDRIRASRRLLLRELERQVLPHGEHCELSPMYHALMLEAVLDVRDAARATAPELSDRCAEVADHMGGFLAGILHPDDHIPLFGDAALDATPAPAVLVARSRSGRPAEASAGETPRIRTIGPYWTWRHGGDFVIFDAGPVAADHLPAHAHCDLLNLEISVGGKRLFTDSGVFGYEDDEMRAYCRSTAAHNVLEIDGRNHCDVWSRFRMGSRGRTDVLRTAFEKGIGSGWSSHDAYRRMGVPVVRREVIARAPRSWIVVDSAVGSGRRQFVNRLHVHPDWQVAATDGRTARIEGDAGTLWVRGIGTGALGIRRGWYCPEFGKRLLRPVLEWTAYGEMPWHGGWIVHGGESPVDARLILDEQGRHLVSWTLGGAEQHHRVHGLDTIPRPGRGK